MAVEPNMSLAMRSITMRPKPGWADFTAGPSRSRQLSRIADGARSQRSRSGRVVRGLSAQASGAAAERLVEDRYAALGCDVLARRWRGPSGEIDLLQQSQKQMRGLRGKEIAMIFQEPMTSLNPVYTIGDQIGEVLTLHEGMTKSVALAEGRRLLDMVRLPDSAELLGRFPHQPDTL